MGVEPPTLLSDGVCNLCNGFVDFVIEHEKAPIIRLGSLQSDVGRVIAEKHGGRPKDLNTVILIEDGKLYHRSSAVLRTARYLRAPWSWIRVFAVVPRPIRDAVYRYVIARRYTWFGQRETCRVPTDALKARVL